MKKFIPTPLRDRILNLSHYPLLAVNPGARLMYDTIRIEYYWTHMNDVYATMKDCLRCASTIGTTYKNQNRARLFPPSGLLEFVAMDVLGPLKKNTIGRK